MENSNCKDYVTEKLGAAIISSAVPIVFSVDGIPNYDRYLPPHSYINAADFQSARKLAEYLKYVGANETLYNEYLWYKYEAMESVGKKEEIWKSILERFLHKETAHHWCRAASAVWNYYRHTKVTGIRTPLPADDSCLDSNVMARYVNRNSDTWSFDRIGNRFVFLERGNPGPSFVRASPQRMMFRKRSENFLPTASSLWR